MHCMLSVKCSSICVNMCIHSIPAFEGAGIDYKTDKQVSGFANKLKAAYGFSGQGVYFF